MICAEICPGKTKVLVLASFQSQMNVVKWSRKGIFSWMNQCGSRNCRFIKNYIILPYGMVADTAKCLNDSNQCLKQQEHQSY